MTLNLFFALQIFLRYKLSSRFIDGAKKYNPIMFGIDIRKTIASEKSKTAVSWIVLPNIMKPQKTNLKPSCAPEESPTKYNQP